MQHHADGGVDGVGLLVTTAAQFDHGADSVVLHGATPADLAPVVDAYRAIRPAGIGDRCARNPGWFTT